jgi:hypothetical protein
MLNPDFKDMLSALSGEKAEFLIVGAYALAFYGLPRATGDIDLFVGTDPDNSKKIFQALKRFGAPLQDVQPETFTQTDLVFQIGVAPSRIDLMTSITGVTFREAWEHRQWTEIEGMKLPVLSMGDLILNKSAVGRPKDKADLEWLIERNKKKMP